MFDCILVGQGIAGSMLAWFLSEAGQKILLIDEFNSASASRVASGVINPVTGKRLVKSWRTDELIPFAKKTYNKLEAQLGIKVFSEASIHRIFSNKEDFQFFRQKKELDELPGCVLPLNEIPACFCEAQYGGIEIRGVYLVNYSLLLAAMRNRFRESGRLLEEKFHFKDLKVKGEQISYRNIEARRIIFCEGSAATENPYFSELPFNFAKGEVVTVSMPNFPQDKIWHKGIFIAPLGNALFRIGATYEWNFHHALPSEKGRAELEKKLSRAVNLPFKIIEHFAAIRPTVKDRRPLIGLHPVFQQIGIFNGMGTKGASLAPFFANHFSNYLLGKNALDAEVSIARIQDSDGKTLEKTEED